MANQELFNKIKATGLYLGPDSSGESHLRVQDQYVTIYVYNNKVTMIQLNELSKFLDVDSVNVLRGGLTIRAIIKE